MSLKLYSIIYRAQNKNEANLIRQIENSTRELEYLRTGKKTYGDCINPKDDYLYIGKFKDYLIINEASMALDFFQEPVSKTERFWRTLSRNSQEIYCFILNGITNMYGFAYLLNQRKIRCKYGTMDESVILDLGALLKSEKDYYERKNTNALIEDGEIEFHQIAEDLIFHFFNEILGESPNYNSDLMNLEMTEYKKVNFDTI